MRHIELQCPASDSGCDSIRPLLIDALPPEEVMMIPLKAETEPADGERMTGTQLRSASEVITAALATESRDGASAGARKYASMLKDLPRVPVLLDAAVRTMLTAS